ncbi:hypothetical protein [Oceanobacter mangrovi]|uniref:hypothetical protein n=1 Tax=Oceanobacter mangrovi TaxID=2862510 RepID=UPI001C8DC593|nr:hypothetical protein [Oceanobacter mangrovi]
MTPFWPHSTTRLLACAAVASLTACGGSSSNSTSEPTTLSFPAISNGYLAYQVNNDDWQQITTATSVSLGSGDTFSLAIGCLEGDNAQFAIGRYPDTLFGWLVDSFGEVPETAEDLCEEESTETVTRSLTFTLTEDDVVLIDGDITDQIDEDIYDSSFTLETSATDDPVAVMLTLRQDENYYLYCNDELSFNDGDQLLLKLSDSHVSLGSSQQITVPDYTSFYSGASLADSQLLVLTSSSRRGSKLVDFSNSSSCEVLNSRYSRIQRGLSDLLVYDYNKQLDTQLPELLADPENYTLSFSGAFAGDVEVSGYQLDSLDTSTLSLDLTGSATLADSQEISVILMDYRQLAASSQTIEFPAFDALPGLDLVIDEIDIEEMYTYFPSVEAVLNPVTDGGGFAYTYYSVDDTASATMTAATAATPASTPAPSQNRFLQRLMAPSIRPMGL